MENISLNASTAPQSKKNRQLANVLRIKRRKEEMGFETNIPSCANCIKRAHNKGSVVSPPFWCGPGDFQTMKTAVCDLWVGTNGDELE